MISIKIIFLLNILFISTTIQNEIPTNGTFDIAENWCCKIEPQVETISQTRQTIFYVLQHSRHKCGYVSCGFLGASRCTRWCSETWVEAQQGVETYYFNRTLSCPNNQLRCCDNYMYVMGHCFSFLEIYNHQQLLSQLNELNIVIPGPSLN